MIILTILLIIALLLIAFFDFKYMAVPLILLIVSLLISFARLIIFNPLKDVWFYSFTNLLGLSLILIISFLVLFVLKRKLFNPLNSFIGTGDLVFFPVVCFSFSPVNFIAFIVISLGALLILKPVLSQSKNTMPLAGGISLIFSILLIFDSLKIVNLYNDLRLMKLLF